MATTERTANSITFTSSGSQAAEIASLRTAITAGNTIFANDLNRVATLINNMNGHYHNYDDAKQLATYGNTGDRTNYVVSINTGVSQDTTSAPTNTAADTQITASRHNELKDAINNIRNHNHEIGDSTTL
jgi:anti-sigma28 factor (negative regulator of flagellin synthesis)